MRADTGASTRTKLLPLRRGLKPTRPLRKTLERVSCRSSDSREDIRTRAPRGPMTGSKESDLAMSTAQKVDHASIRATAD